MVTVKPPSLSWLSQERNPYGEVAPRRVAGEARFPAGVVTTRIQARFASTSSAGSLATNCMPSASMTATGGPIADRASAQKWATEYGLQGRVLTLTKANELATEEWKSLTNGGEVDVDSKP